MAGSVGRGGSLRFEILTGDVGIGRDDGVVVTWADVAADAPELAAAVQGRFEAFRHHVLATRRRDGTPRVSGTEVQFHPPDVLIGSMPGALKALDLRRSAGFALHANPGDGSMEGGDAKLSGRAVEVTDPVALAAYTEAEQPPGPFHLFRLEIDSVVLTSLHPDGDRLFIASWRPGRGVLSTERR